MGELRKSLRRKGEVKSSDRLYGRTPFLPKPFITFSNPSHSLKPFPLSEILLPSQPLSLSLLPIFLTLWVVKLNFEPLPNNNIMPAKHNSPLFPSSMFMPSKIIRGTCYFYILPINRQGIPYWYKLRNLGNDDIKKMASQSYEIVIKVNKNLNGCKV